MCVSKQFTKLMQTHEITNLNRMLTKLKSARRKLMYKRKKADKVDDEYLNTEMSVVSKSAVTMENEISELLCKD